MGTKQPHDGSSRDEVLTEIRPGARVITSDHKRVAKVHDVIVDADNGELTRIVVNTGPYFPAPGFGAPKLVSVSPEEIEEVHHGRVQIRCSASVFDHLPIYADWYIGGTPVGLSGGRRATAWKIPHRGDSEREIQRGVGVWRIEPFVHIGDVERVLVDDHLGHVRAIVLREGHIFGHNVVLPIDYVVEFHDAFIHVQMTDAETESLEPFHSAPET